ncbi:hypothetical protein [Sphingobacterium spiritivorum]
MKRFLFLIPIVFLSFMFHIEAKAQPHYDIQINTASSLHVEEGVVQLSIEVINTGPSIFKGSLKVDAPVNLSLLSQNTVEIAAGKKKYLSFKFKCSGLANLKDKAIQITAIQQGNAVSAPVRIRLDVAEKRAVTLHNMTDVQLLQRVGDIVYVKALIRNEGTSDEKVNLVFSSPDRIGSRSFQTISMDLPSGKDTLVTYSFTVEKYMMQLPRYNLNINGLYPSNDIFGNLSLVFNNVSSVRNYDKMFRQDPDINTYSRNNIEWIANNIGELNSMYYLRSVGEYELSKAKYLRYNLYATTYGKIAEKPQITNTWINVEKNNKGIVAGNLQESYDMFFYGRGVKFYTADSAKNNSFEAAVAEKSFDLLASNASGQGYSAYVRTVLGDQLPDRKYYSGTLFYDHSSYDSTESFLFSNTFGFFKQAQKDKIRLDADIGVGLTNRLHPLAGMSDDSRPSAALGIRLFTRQKGFTYSSDNYVSTAYYPGNRRGSIQLNQYINRKLGNVSITAGYLFNKYNPKYLNRNLLFDMEATNSRANIDFTMAVNDLLTYSFQPNYTTESGNSFINNSYPTLSIKSWTLNNIFYLRSRNYRHTFYISFETGVSRLKNIENNAWIYRGNFSYNYDAFNLYGNFQKGNFHIYDALPNLSGVDEQNYRVSISPSYQKQFWNKKMSATVGAILNISSYSGENYIGNASLQYRVFKNTILSSSYYYYYLNSKSNYTNGYGNIQVGVRQNLPSGVSSGQQTKNGDLEVFCFYDNNNNGIFDTGDSKAVNYTLLINDLMLTTDRQGQVAFKNIPYGELAVVFPPKDGFQANNQKILINKSKTKLSVPLQQSVQIEGTIQLAYDAVRSVAVDTDLLGYKVYAKDNYGHVFESQTDTKGSYLLLLPEGEYIFFMDESTFPENIYLDQNSYPMKVTIGQKATAPAFNLQIKAKNIQIKRF